MGRSRNKRLVLGRAYACAVFLLSLCCAVQLSAGVHVSTEECAWLPGGGQGRTGCAKAAGPAAPNVLRWRVLGAGPQYGTSFGGIGAEHVLFKGWPGEYPTCLLARDGHTLVSIDDRWGAAETLDDSHLYLSSLQSRDEAILYACSSHGSLQWQAVSITGDCVPVNRRGLAVFGPWYDLKTMQFFDADGCLISEDSLRIPGEDMCTVDIPAFNSDGVAVWQASTSEEWPWGGGKTYYFHAASEVRGDFFEFYSGSSSPEMPYGACPFVKVNALDNVLLHAGGELLLYEDVTLENVLWQHHIAGSGTWEEACGDPMGGWWVVHAENESDGTDRVMLQRINPDGSLGPNKVIDRLERTMKYHPICDIEGNVYYCLGGEVMSYSPEGEGRWRMHLSEKNVWIHGMDSRGVIYVSEFYASPPRLFAIGDGEPHHSRVRVKLPERAAGDVYSAGEEVVVLVQPYNFGEDEVVDGYLAVILPTGAVSYYTDSGWSESPAPWFPNVYLPNSFEIIDAPLSLGVIPESPPEGTYTVIAGFCQPGTLTPVDELFPLTFEVAAD